MKRLLALALAMVLGAGSAFGANDVRPQVQNPTSGLGVWQTGQASGSANVFTENLPAGVAFYASAAIGPKRLREACLNVGVSNGVWAESTVVIATNGAKRIGIYIYALADSNRAAGSDSGRVLIFGALPKAHLIASLPDSGNSAIWNPIIRASSLYGANTAIDTVLSRLSTDPGVWLGTSTTTTALAINSGTFVPGEIPVYYNPGRWYQNLGSGRPPWTYTEFCTPDYGCFAPAFFSVRIRLAGEAKGATIQGQLRNASTSWLRDNTEVYMIRVDVIGYYN